MGCRAARFARARTRQLWPGAVSLVNTHDGTLAGTLGASIDFVSATGAGASTYAMESKQPMRVYELRTYIRTRICRRRLHLHQGQVTPKC